MKVLLIDIDSKIPNLALKKIEKYHQDKGDIVVWNNPLEKNLSDKIYVSCIFTKNKHICKEWEGIAEIGGTGYDLHKKLPEYIEIVKPKINWGFTTRGCIRKCKFCFVPEKEGNIHVVGDIYDIWDGLSKKIVIMDNNILALPKHFEMIASQIKKEKIKVDFNQGLDLRLLTSWEKDILKELRHEEYKFAWDGDDDLEGKLLWLKENLGRCTIFIICGFPDDNYVQVLKKFNYLKSIGHNGYAMRHENYYNCKKYITLARWVNQHHIFHSYTLEQFIEHEKKGKVFKKTNQLTMQF